jgi:hypothetical protein
MAPLSAIIRMFDIRHVGTCPTCMRISFGAMILSWVFTFGVLTVDFATAAFLFGISVLLTLLWLAHIVRRAVQSVLSDQSQIESRRLALRFGVSLAGAAVTSIAFPGRSRADSACGGWGSSCEPCTSQYGSRGNCMRQNSSCGCYYCRSCGNGCGNNVC